VEYLRPLTERQIRSHNYRRSLPRNRKARRDKNGREQIKNRIPNQPPPRSTAQNTNEYIESMGPLYREQEIVSEEQGRACISHSEKTVWLQQGSIPWLGEEFEPFVWIICERECLYAGQIRAFGVLAGIIVSKSG